MATESKRAKLTRFEKKRTELQVQLAQLATRREMLGNDGSGGLGHFYSMRNPKHNAQRANMKKQMNNLQKKIAGYTAKIDTLKKEIYI